MPLGGHVAQTPWGRALDSVGASFRLEGTFIQGREGCGFMRRLAQEGIPVSVLRMPVQVF